MSKRDDHGIKCGRCGNWIALTEWNYAPPEQLMVTALPCRPRRLRPLDIWALVTPPRGACGGKFGRRRIAMEANGTETCPQCGGQPLHTASLTAHCASAASSARTGRRRFCSIALT